MKVDSIVWIFTLSSQSFEMLKPVHLDEAEVVCSQSYKFMQNSYKLFQNKWLNRRDLIVTAPEKMCSASNEKHLRSAFSGFSIVQ